MNCTVCGSQEVKDVHFNPDSDAGGAEGYCGQCQRYTLISMQPTKRK